jgi:hypothetical protein
MPAWRFYGDENERWPELHAAKVLGREEVELGIRRLAREFGLPLRGVHIEFTSGNRHSRAGRRRIRINMDFANWLLVAHEVGHTYWFTKYHARREGRRSHGRQLAKIIDRFCEWITTQGWAHGALAHELALQEVSFEQEERAAATPPPIESRIARREAQIARLERRIKALTTRVKRAKRSLAALLRVREKMNRRNP